MAQAVEAELRHPVFLAPGAADVTAEGRAERVVAGVARWRAVVRLSDRAGIVLGERIVESRSRPNHQPEAVFLLGLPDVDGSRPHEKGFVNSNG